MSSKIEWTEHTWNPIVGCRRVSPGCEHCYAERFVHRSMSKQHKGLTVAGRKGVRWNGEVNIAEHRFAEPLKRKKPTTYFVNSLSDMFYEPLSNELIAALFGVMAASPHHTYQILTKRPERGREFFGWLVRQCVGTPATYADFLRHRAWCKFGELPIDKRPAENVVLGDGDARWPLPNVHLGVSIESEGYLGRVMELAQCPAAVRWVSQEPQIGRIQYAPGHMDLIDWIVVGGESGPKARPFDLEWLELTIDQCERHRIPVFVKQFGDNPGRLRSARAGKSEEWVSVAGMFGAKGGNMDLFPAWAKRREMPDV